MAKARLTVLQMLPALESGGVERGTLEVGAALVKAGHRSLVMSAGGRLVKPLQSQGSEHFTWPVGRKSLWSLRLVRPLRRFLREQRVDVLHVRSRLPAWIAWLAWRGMDPATRPRLVTTVHGFYSVGRYSAVMARGERVIAVSDSIRDYILANYPDTPPERIVVIPRGIDPAFFTYGYRAPVGWSRTWLRQYPHLSDACVLTLPGRLTRLKGHEDFIELMARLVRRGLPVQGLIVGDEDPRRRRYAQGLRQRVHDLDLEGHITFSAGRSDIREVYASSNIVLSLSRKPESFGRTVLEALSLGVPVIGYDHGGVGDILEEIYPQGSVAVGDIDGLADKVAAFMQDAPPVPSGHGFTLQRMLDSTLDLYRQLGQKESTRRLG